jgi:hypothetical protein
MTSFLEDLMLGIVTPPVTYLLAHCPIIAELSRKINTFFEKFPIIFLFFSDFAYVVVGFPLRLPYIDVSADKDISTADKISCQGEIFHPKKCLL